MTGPTMKPERQPLSLAATHARMPFYRVKVVTDLSNLGARLRMPSPISHDMMVRFKTVH